MREQKTNKKLRTGFTTGTCATGAAKAAALMLRDGSKIHEISVKTPKGPVMTAEVLDITRTDHSVKCAVQKDAGDDPDVTNGSLVYAEVSFIKKNEVSDRKSSPFAAKNETPDPANAVPAEKEEMSVPADRSSSRIVIDGGEGIGRVTKPGLDQPIGNAAINSTPRRMIREAIEEVFPWAADQEASDPRGIKVIISIPAGVELAAKTFNPKLGIVGGISVLGTSGIVKPMSDEALLATIKVEINVRKAEGYTAVLAAPGNYGLDFLVDTYDVPSDIVVSSSNFICDTVQMASKAGFRKMLFVGHIGKMIKVAGGIRNTHSRYGDHRMEIVSEIAGEIWDRCRERSVGSGESHCEEDEPAGVCDQHKVSGTGDRQQAGGTCDQKKAEMFSKLAGCVMMDEAVRILKEYGIADETFSEAARRVKAYMESWAAEALTAGIEKTRTQEEKAETEAAETEEAEADAAQEAGGKMTVETILFGGDGILAKTEKAEELLWYILSERDRVRSISSQ